ncbi:hypothetical protein CPB83DRAFT_203539 [Crepidotus variabilis]|uniref:Uncharacterized protein n=1 Tax=Crepidotus variabilis TaxID=179855 RepID=A0A9P6ER66_9AGAR|nr:hypothetical protein CPB83DRAFT_203539 [Crepidotus variabilis]
MTRFQDADIAYLTSLSRRNRIHLHLFSLHSVVRLEFTGVILTCHTYHIDSNSPLAAVITSQVFDDVMICSVTTYNLKLCPQINIDSEVVSFLSARFRKDSQIYLEISAILKLLEGTVLLAWSGRLARWMLLPHHYFLGSRGSESQVCGAPWLQRRCNSSIAL